MDESNDMEEYKQQLPVLFKQILLLFKEAPSGNSWALEKLMEVFCKDIAHNMDIVKAVDFISFLNGFLEDNSLIQYPDFVMNDASLMAAEVLSTCDDHSFLESPAFDIIRSPLRYWMVTKGHRVDVTFQIYKKWVHQRSVLYLLDGVQFDVSQALVHCLASPYNYTRQSAGDYFLELIKLTHNSHPKDADDETLCEIKSRLRSTICQLISQFNAAFIKSTETVRCTSNKVEICAPHEGFFSFHRKAAVNYCRLLSECAVACNEWCRSNTETDMFDQLVVLLQVIASDNDVDRNDLFRPTTAMLVRLVTYSSDSQHLKVKKLIRLLVHVAEIRNCSISSDAVFMAGLILTQLNTEMEDQSLLVELSILPLFILFDVTPHSSLSTCPVAVDVVKSFLKTAQKYNPSGLLKVAVENLSRLAETQIIKSCYDTFIDYLELRRIDSPTEVGLPILIGSSIRSDTILRFLVLQLSKINLAFNQATDGKCPVDSIRTYSLVENVQTYTKACLDHPSISCAQISSVIDCYLAVLKHLRSAEQCKNSTLIAMAEETSCAYNTQILHDVLHVLQFKMFDRDPNVREVAVSAVGNLFFIVHEDNSSPEASADMTACLSSLWQCVDNKTESVAMRVLELLLEASVRGQLDALLALMNATQTDVVTRLDKFLLSFLWDDIKPVAFKLLTRVCSLDVLVRYAEACLHQDNALLAVAVLDYIQDIFSQHGHDVTLDQKVDTVTSLLIQGWGDLILQKTNAADVCSFRKASSIVAKVLAFLEQQNVCSLIDEKVSDFCFSIGKTQKRYCDKAHTQFAVACDEVLKVHGHLNSSLHTPTMAKVSDQSEHLILDTAVNFKPRGHPQMTTKRKGSDITNGDEEIPLNKFQRYDEHKLSNVCLICSFIDAEKISSAERDLQQTKNSDCMSETKQVLDNDESYPHYTKKNITDNDDVYLDSTKEMPALTLRTYPFASQKKIQDILLHCNKYSDPIKLAEATAFLSWFLFQEMFQRIDPGSLQEEAQRSTDEYERNSVTILCDLGQVMRRRLHSLHDHLETELTKHFLSTFSNFLNKALNAGDSKTQGQLLKDIIKSMCTVKLLEHKKESVITFILHKRRSILKIPFENNESEFVLDHFLERLNFLSSQGSKGYVRECYASADGLKVLLQLFVNEETDGTMTHHLNNFSECAKKNSDNDLNLEVNTSKVIAILHNTCGEVSNAEITAALAYLEPGDIHLLGSILDGELDDLETLHACVKILLNSSRRDTFQPVLQLVQSLSKLIILGVCERDDEIRAERYSNIGACFSQLEKWYLDEDEFDSDGHDDPTSVDCV